MATVSHEFSNFIPLLTADGDSYRAIFIHDHERDTYECWYDKRLKIVYDAHELPPEVTEALAFIRAVPPERSLSDPNYFKYDYQAYENKHSKKLDGIGWRSGTAYGRTVYCILIPAGFLAKILRRFAGENKNV